MPFLRVPQHKSDCLINYKDKRLLKTIIGTFAVRVLRWSSLHTIKITLQNTNIYVLLL